MSAGSPAPRPGTVLVTGGAGFVGSHTAVALLQDGHDVVVIDDYSNSAPDALAGVQAIAGRDILSIYRADVRDSAKLDAIFSNHRIDTVVHFAARKAVRESVHIPLDYYDVNVGATVALLHAMTRHRIPKLLFSSSCSVYGEAEGVLTEESPTHPTNPYARSKLFCEQIIDDACKRHPELAAVALRYFNPIGAHPSGQLGEDPLGVPNNLMPYLVHVASGRLKHVTIFGTDWPTADGTCVRDYVHIADVADAHRLAVQHLNESPVSGLYVLNVGSGVGTSVRELVAAFSAASGVDVPCRSADRRPGDVASLVADPSRIAASWGWRATRGVAEACEDAWRFECTSRWTSWTSRLDGTDFVVTTVESAADQAIALPIASFLQDRRTPSDLLDARPTRTRQPVMQPSHELFSFRSAGRSLRATRQGGHGSRRSAAVPWR